MEQEDDFRVTFDGNGGVRSVEFFNGVQWKQVPCNKGFPIESPNQPISVIDMKTVHIFFGDVDPCVEVGGRLYCWKNK